MTMPKSPDQDQDPPQGPLREAGKKPYERPSFIREQVFETMALACGKINPSSGPCNSVKKKS
jgi:hypothetical protein